MVLDITPTRITFVSRYTVILLVYWHLLRGTATMREESELRCANCPQPTAFDSRQTCFRRHYSRFEHYTRNSSDSSEDWLACNTTGNCNYDAATSEFSPEEDDRYQKGRANQDQVKSKNYLNPEAKCRAFAINIQSSSQAEGKSARQERETFLCSKFERENSFSDESFAFSCGESRTNKSQKPKEVLTDSSLKFMSPQDQSMLATPVNGNSPGYSITPSPHSASSVPGNSFRDIDGRYRSSSNSAEIGSAELQMSNPTISCSQNLEFSRNNVNEDNCDTNLEEMKNGEIPINGKISSNETIYPWMKESRQNQKKKQTASVSSSEDNDKGFTGNKRERTAYTNSQLVELEKEFHYSHYLCRPRRIELANSLNLSERQIKIWFQNRRMKYKKEQKQNIMMRRNSDMGPGLGPISLPSGHQRHYPFSYFHQQHRQALYPDEPNDKCKSGIYSRMNPNALPYQLQQTGNNHRKETNPCRATNAVRSPTQQLQSFVTSSMSTLQSPATMHQQHLTNQTVPCSPTSNNNPSGSPLQIKSIYSEGHGEVGTATVVGSPNHERMQQRNDEVCSGASLSKNNHSLSRKERLYHNIANAGSSENGYSKFPTTGTFMTGDANKVISPMDLYQSRSGNDNHNCRHYHTSYCHQNVPVSSFGEYQHNALPQDGNDVPLRHSFTQASQRSLPPQFLPFAYYGAASEIDYLSSCSSAMSMNSNKEMPLDYSRTTYHAQHGFSDRLTKSSFDKPPQSTFVSANFARLTHL